MKRKKRTRNENTEMSEQAKVGGKFKQVTAMGSSLQNLRDRVERRKAP